ncbi:hypothetical protein Salat_1846800 [Sesamum alatum]|uniref:Uncharacterized protein n=1 Tax=Sesamum alatum TaxID=300844 RepID=A0AAE2CHR9_9LAMI|nr:hypothetical protein Salat_1846800 [Sesamum alatum]
MGIVSNAVWMVLLLLICASAADNEMVAGAVSASLRRPPAGVALSASRRPPPAGVALSASRRPPPPAGAVSVNRYPPYYRCTSNLGPCGRDVDESDCQRLCFNYYSWLNPKAYCNIFCFCEHTCL